MVCSIHNCNGRSIVNVSLMGIVFQYCRKHKSYLNKILVRKNRSINYIKRLRFGVYELNEGLEAAKKPLSS